MKGLEFRVGSGVSKKLRRPMLASQKELANELDDLPDNLIHHILSFMETKDAIQTCVLSRRWRYMWTSLPCLNLNTKSFSHLSDFKRFVKRAISYHDCTSQWLLNKVVESVTSHGVEEIQINFGGKSCGNSPIEIPSTILFACQSLKRNGFKTCHPSDDRTSVIGYKSLEMLHLEHYFPLQHPDQSNPFCSLQKFSDFTKLTTLCLNRFTLSCPAGTSCLDPFANCVNLKNLHLSDFCFESDLNPRGFVISAPQLQDLTLACNRFRCKLVVSAQKLNNFSYIHASSSACFDFSHPSMDNLTIYIHELHNDELEIYQQRRREETLHCFINFNVIRQHHNILEAVEVSSFPLPKFTVTCEAASLLKCEGLSIAIRSDLAVGSTSRYLISDLERITTKRLSCSQQAEDL